MADSPQSPPQWAVAKASVIGRGHVTQNLPCQDAHGWFPLPGASGWGVAVVSDGAGSCENSQLGSEQVVNLAGWKFTALLNENGWATGQPLPTAADWQTLALDGFREVAEHLRHYAEENQIAYRSLGATAIVAVFGPTGLLLAHIGDGRAAGQNPDGEWLPLLIPFRGEEANSTVFITSRPWLATDGRYLGSGVFDFPMRAFALLSDGCEMATFQLSAFDAATGLHQPMNQPFRPVFDSAAAQLLALHQQGLPSIEIDRLWAHYLTAGTEKLANETDDKTWLLALNLAEALNPVAAPVTPLEAVPVELVTSVPVVAATPAMPIAQPKPAEPKNKAQGGKAKREAKRAQAKELKIEKNHKRRS